MRVRGFLQRKLRVFEEFLQRAVFGAVAFYEGVE